MELKTLVAVGKVNKTHGVRGLLKVQFNFPLSQFKGLPFKSVFIGKASNPLPYFLNSFEDFNDGQYLLGLEEINGREKAVTFSNKELFLPKDVANLAFDMEATDDFAALEGYLLFDQDNNEIGKIEEVLTTPGQYLAVIIVAGQEVLIPLNDEQLIGIDQKKKTIQVYIPEGLLDLNRGE